MYDNILCYINYIFIYYTILYYISRAIYIINIYGQVYIINTHTHIYIFMFIKIRQWPQYPQKGQELMNGSMGLEKAFTKTSKATLLRHLNIINYKNYGGCVRKDRHVRMSIF